MWVDDSGAEGGGRGRLDRGREDGKDPDLGKKRWMFVVW